MTELASGSAKREAMLFAQMMRALRIAKPKATDEQLRPFAEAFVRDSRPRPSPSPRPYPAGMSADEFENRTGDLFG